MLNVYAQPAIASDTVPNVYRYEYRITWQPACICSVAEFILVTNTFESSAVHFGNQ